MAASTSTAAAARELRRRPATAGARREPGALEVHQQLPSVRGLAGESAQERRQPGGQFKRRLGAQRRGAGERHGHPEDFVARPEADQRGADRRTRPAGVQPGMNAMCRGEQRRRRRWRRPAKCFLGLLDIALLVEIRCDDPLVQRQRMPGGIEDFAAIDDAQRAGPCAAASPRARRRGARGRSAGRRPRPGGAPRRGGLSIFLARFSAGTRISTGWSFAVSLKRRPQDCSVRRKVPLALHCSVGCRRDLAGELWSNMRARVGACSALSALRRSCCVPRPGRRYRPTR